MMPVSKHVQYAVVSCLFLVSGLTVALVGAENTTLPTYAVSFVRTEPNTVTDQSNPFAGAKFDIQSYVSNPCYDIVGNEVGMCETEYGISTPLKQYVIDGSLLQYLNDHGLLAAPTTTVKEELPASDVTPSAANPNDMYDMEHRIRNEHLWSICSSKYEDYSDAAFCFQRNIRLSRRFGTAIDPDIIK